MAQIASQVSIVLLLVPALAHARGDGQDIGIVVRNVVVWTAVNDRRGHPKSGLDQSDFRVLQDGVAQRITGFELGDETPLSAQILVDASKSMELSGLMDVTRGACRYLLSRLRPRDSASLWYFAGRRTHHECDVGTPPERIGEALLALHGFGETTLRDSIYESLTAQRTAPASRRAVFLFTDGKDNASRVGEEELAVLASSLNVPIHAIILSPRPERDFDPAPLAGLRRIVELSGGLFVIIYPFDPKGSIAAIDDALGLLRSSYVLEYSPEGTPRRGFHRIEVKVKCRRCTVIHRQGYYER